MKKFLLISLVIVLSTGLAFAKGYEVKKKAGEYSVEATMDRNPPAVGKNNLDVTIKDASGKNVADVNVLVEYGMPLMPGMPPMNYKTDARLDGGVYKAVLNISMPGPWYVSLKINRAGKTTSTKFTFDAR